MESNHLLASFLPHLLDAFPTAGVVLLVRECRSWIDSMINDQLNLRQWDGYSRWQVVYDSYMVPAPAEAFPPEERTLQELGLYPLSHYVRYWREEAEQVRKLASPKRLLELRTGDLADRADEIAAFTGIPAARIDRALSHSYRAPKKHDILARLDPGYVSRALGSEA